MVASAGKRGAAETLVHVLVETPHGTAASETVWQLLTKSHVR